MDQRDEKKKEEAIPTMKATQSRILINLTLIHLINQSSAVTLLLPFALFICQLISVSLQPLKLSTMKNMRWPTHGKIKNSCMLTYFNLKLNCF